MDTQEAAVRPDEAFAEEPVVRSHPENEQPASADEVSSDDFENVVNGALEAVGGTLLFKMRVGADAEAFHAAAATVGVGESRQFLVLTLPARRGGSLKVEASTHSDSPVAGIVQSYADLMDVLNVAA
jgi:hypothetical protein